MNDHLLFSNSAPTVGIFLLDTSGNVLLSVRGIEPVKGTLDSFGGFVDMGESFEQAAVRETEEETGLTASDYSPLTYLTSATNSYDFGGEAREVLSCFFYATVYDSANPRAKDDVASIVRVKPHDVDVASIGGDDVRAGLNALLEMLS